jgi:hypothetical protein
MASGQAGGWGISNKFNWIIHSPDNNDFYPLIIITRMSVDQCCYFSIFHTVAPAEVPAAAARDRRRKRKTNLRSERESALTWRWLRFECEFYANPIRRRVLCRERVHDVTSQAHRTFTVTRDLVFIENIFLNNTAHTHTHNSACVSTKTCLLSDNLQCAVAFFSLSRCCCCCWAGKKKTMKEFWNAGISWQLAFSNPQQISTQRERERWGRDNS